MRFYQNLFGPIEDAYGKWFVRICLVAGLLSAPGFFTALVLILEYPEAEGLVTYWSFASSLVFAAVLAVGAARWLIRTDKVLFLLAVAYLFLGRKAQAVRNERFDSTYDTSTNGWEYLVMMVMAVAAVRVWMLWRRSQREQELARVLAEARLESEPVDAE